MFKGKKRYGEFQASDEKIASNILADRLKRLDAAGIVSKERDPENKTKFIYSLTSKGLDLMPILLEMTVWSAKHDAHTIMQIKSGTGEHTHQLLLDMYGYKR